MPVYNLELFGGAIHNSPGFALAWGAFPLLTGYFACAGTITWVALLAAGYAALTSYVQRVLSTPVRHVRRRVMTVTGAAQGSASFLIWFDLFTAARLLARAKGISTFRLAAVRLQALPNLQ